MIQTFTMVVKGDATVARRAALRRGFTATSVGKTNEGGTKLTVTGERSVADQWFSERIGNAPFSDGTLLYMRIHD